LGWKTHVIIGNTLFFPHITANAYIGGGIGNHSSLILDENFIQALKLVITDRSDSRCDESWDDFPDHPMLQETAINFSAAVANLLASNAGMPVNIVFASHATLPQTEQFWRTLFFYYNTNIEAAFGTQQKFEETLFHFCGGHHHHLFDPSVEESQGHPTIPAPFTVKLLLFNTEKSVNFTAEEMFGTHLHVITVPRQSPTQ
jgi:hypothetical protein